MDHDPLTCFRGSLHSPSRAKSSHKQRCFRDVFDDNIISLIVRETNRFAAQILGPASTEWTTSAAEIKAYLGFMVVMGITRLPEIRDYWAVDTKMHNTFIASRITRDHFEENITRYLHFVDNTTLPSRDETGYHRLQKIMPAITAMKEKFVGNYNPHPENSIDEAMIPFKGIYTIYMYLLGIYTLYILYIHVNLPIPRTYILHTHCIMLYTCKYTHTSYIHNNIIICMYDVCVYLHNILTSLCRTSIAGRLCNRISLYVQCMGIFTCIIIHTQCTRHTSI